ncbi:hypothetical protein L6452_36560 [Arctium lappa]|uniref:Uncharacterized protein n=1 Tax=Arctium lappa TaxID=4217 RepID=A0ACB8YA72_ARCLA|nr:hypothetical protein L6452_36560 [Arctium lappa]
MTSVGDSRDLRGYFGQTSNSHGPTLPARTKRVTSHVWYHMLHTHPIPTPLRSCQFLHTSADNPNPRRKNLFLFFSTPAGTTTGHNPLITSQRLSFLSGGF